MREHRNITIRKEGEPPKRTAPPKPKRIRKYKVDAYCDNCDWEGKVGIPRGTVVVKNDRMGVAADCPHCGCQELIRGFLDETTVEEQAEITDGAGMMRRLEELMEEERRNRPHVSPQPMLPQIPIEPARQDVPYYPFEPQPARWIRDGLCGYEQARAPWSL